MPTFRNTLSVPSSHLPLKMEQIECSETSAYTNQTPGNHPKENKLHKRNLSDIKYGYSILLWDIAIKWLEVNTIYRRILRPISELSTTFYSEADIWSLLPSLESFSLLTNEHLSPSNKGGLSRKFISVCISRSQSSPRAFRLCPVVPAATWRITKINFGNVIRFFLNFPLRLLLSRYPDRQNVSVMAQAVNRHTSSCGIYGGQNDIPTGSSPSVSDFTCRHHSTSAPHSFVHLTMMLHNI